MSGQFTHCDSKVCQASCAHEQIKRAHGLQWARSIGVANKSTLFVTLMGHAKEIKTYWSQFSLILTDSLCLHVAQMPRSRDVVIFVPKTDRWRRQTKPIVLPLAHVRGVISLVSLAACTCMYRPGQARWDETNYIHTHTHTHKHTQHTHNTHWVTDTHTGMAGSHTHHWLHSFILDIMMQ